MRNLEPSIIFLSFFITTVMVGISFVNVFVFVRYKRNISIVFIHILSLWMILAMFCLLMDTVILGLCFEYTYKQLFNISIALFVVTLVIYIIIFLLTREKRYYYGLDISNYKNIYTYSRELSFVVDYRGVVVDCNHPEILNDLCQNNNKLIDILRELKGKILCQNLFVNDISEIRENIESEIYIDDKDIYYLMKISPITSNGGILGYIVLFQDISAIRRSEIELKRQNECIKTNNEELVQYMKINASLESEKKRVQILEHVQKSILEKIEIAIFQISKINCKRFNNLSYKEEIKQVSLQLKSVYNDVRISVNSISEKKVNNYD